MHSHPPASAWPPAPGARTCYGWARAAPPAPCRRPLARPSRQRSPQTACGAGWAPGRAAEPAGRELGHCRNGRAGLVVVRGEVTRSVCRWQGMHGCIRDGDWQPSSATRKQPASQQRGRTNRRNMEGHTLTAKNSLSSTTTIAAVTIMVVMDCSTALTSAAPPLPPAAAAAPAPAAPAAPAPVAPLLLLLPLLAVCEPCRRQVWVAGSYTHVAPPPNPN